MRTENVNSISFKHWSTPIAVLKKEAAKLTTEEASRANGFIDKFDRHIDHFFSFDKKGLSAEHNRIVADSFNLSSEEVEKKGFLQSLKILNKFVEQQKSVLPKRERRFGFMERQLYKMADRDFNSTGFTFSQPYLYGYLARILEDAEKNNALANLQSIINQIKRIDKKAIRQGIRLFVVPYKEGGLLMVKNDSLLHIMKERASLERLNHTEAFLDKLLQESHAKEKQPTSKFQNIIELVRRKFQIEKQIQEQK